MDFLRPVSTDIRHHSRIIMSDVDENQPDDSSKQDAINDLENLGAWSMDQDDLERDVAKQVSLVPYLDLRALLIIR